jgi:hypothetical protein
MCLLEKKNVGENQSDQENQDAEFTQARCEFMNQPWNFFGGRSLYQIFLLFLTTMMLMMLALFFYHDVVNKNALPPMQCVVSNVSSFYTWLGYFTTWGFIFLLLNIIAQTMAAFSLRINVCNKFLLWILRNVSICLALSISFLYWSGFFIYRPLVRLEDTTIAFLNTIDVHFMNSIIALLSLVSGRMIIQWYDAYLSYLFYGIYYYFYMYWCENVIYHFIYFQNADLSPQMQKYLPLLPVVMILLVQILMCYLSQTLYAVTKIENEILVIKKPNDEIAKNISIENYQL